jgi:hypothetical protein
MSSRYHLPFIAALFVSLGATGCSMPQMNVKAQAGRPESAEITQISIPYDPSKPRFVLVVEPLRLDGEVSTQFSGAVDQWRGHASATTRGSSFDPEVKRLSAQLTTGLTRVGNFVLYDRFATKKPTLRKGEKGPYTVRATLTEFNENAESAANDNSFSLGGVGAVMGIAGAVAGKPGLMWSGAGLAAADPGIEQSEAIRRGMVAFDVQISDPSGRIVSAFEASGTFTAQSAVNGFSLFGFSNRQAQFASSAVGQALRMAVNDVVQKSADALM